jgi:hypothetical protein
MRFRKVHLPFSHCEESGCFWPDDAACLPQAGNLCLEEIDEVEAVIASPVHRMR